MAGEATDPRLDAFDFPLPDDRIARFPPEARDGGRLLDLRGAEPVDRTLLELPSLLRRGDLLVLNDVAVHRARLRARRASGGAVEVLLVRPEGSGWEALVRPGRRIREGEVLACGRGTVELLARRPDGSWHVRPAPDVETVTSSAGEVPLPPYLGRAATALDAERYQTVYARPDPDLRAAAAPTAGLHFTPALLAAVAGRGVRVESLTLEVGAGTFRPLDAHALDTGRLHRERYEVPEATWEAVAATRRAGGRVIAVGTTVTRVLESAEGPGVGETDVFLRPGSTFRRVDVLLTNFHLPRSSLLLLVCAFGGTERVLRAYREAVARGYRFYSYGDAMLVEPG